MFSTSTLLVILSAIAASASAAANTTIWDLTSLDTLVVFGDSYSDDSRFAYFYTHNGTAPPVGWVNPANYFAADGGRVWPQYVAQYSNAHIANYAVGGAVCSDSLTPKSTGTFTYPDIAGYEVPAYLADSAYTLPNGTRFLNDDPSTTVYAFWTGTNDLGAGGFLTDSQVSGTDIQSYLDCVYEQVAKVYAHGGRYFVLMNVVPLNLTPVYGDSGIEGEGLGIGYNQTMISYRMEEQVVGVNAVYKYRTAFETQLANEYPGAKIVVYDVHQLFMDIYNDPSAYLNGTAPLDVKGYATHCNLTAEACASPGRLDSYLWYNQLHPSEQVERIVARNFLDVVDGGSQYAEYWSG